MTELLNPRALHPPIGAYSHTVKVPRNAEWLVMAGQVGMTAKGRLASGVRKQAEQAFRNVLAGLRANGMRKEHLVKLTIYLTDSRYIEEYREGRRAVIGDATRPASTLVIVAGLASSDMYIEVDAWAAMS